MAVAFSSSPTRSMPLPGDINLGNGLSNGFQVRTTAMIRSQRLICMTSRWIPPLKSNGSETVA